MPLANILRQLLEAQGIHVLLVLREGRETAIDEVDHACLTSAGRVIGGNDPARERLDLRRLLASKKLEGRLGLGDLVCRVREGLAAFRDVRQEPNGPD